MGNYDRRNDLKNPVFRFEAGTFIIAAASTASAISNVPVSGIIDTLIVTINNSTNDVTTTITILDEDNYILYTSDALARNTTHVLTGLAILVTPNIRIGALSSGVPGASTLTGTVVLYGV